MPMEMMSKGAEGQSKQPEWYEQWSLVKADELFLFVDWIAPNTLDDFKGKQVLECGCGSGQHSSFVAPYAQHLTAVDLNTVSIAAKRNNAAKNVQFVEADIATMQLGKTFDYVFSIGVVHHTDNPDNTVENLKQHVKPGGKLILWVYSKEGNFMAEHLVERFRKLFLTKMPRKWLLGLSKFITALVCLPVYTLYLLPLKFLPYYAYFQNFRKLSFERNAVNTFDHLNAPYVEFISKHRIGKWFSDGRFELVSLSMYKNVSWRITAQKADRTEV